MFPTSRIVPVSKWLVTFICKALKLFITTLTYYLGALQAIVINHLPMGGSSNFFLMDEQEIYYGRPVVAISLITDTMSIYVSLKCCETLHYYCYGTNYRRSAHAFCVDVSMHTQPPHNAKWRNVTSPKINMASSFKSKNPPILTLQLISLNKNITLRKN